MNKLWRRAMRGILVLGLTGTMMLASGCGDDDDDDVVVTDTTPDAFVFTGQTDVPLDTTTTSNPVIVNGINAAAPITITGGTYSINGGTFTSTAGTVTNNQIVTVRHTSSATNSTATTTTLNIGGVSAPFTTVTVAAAGSDTTPGAFSFPAQTSVPLSTATTSAPITVAGINGPAPISITGGTYSINGGAYTSTVGTVTTGQTVTVQHPSSGANGTDTTTTLTIGGVSADFTSTTLAGAAGLDTTPDAFSFTPKTGVALNTATTSNAITVGGINGAAPISIAGGNYSISGGPFTSAPGTVSNGQTVIVQHPSSATGSTVTTTTLTIGGVSAPFTSTTVAADTTPDAFSFTAQTGVPLSTVTTSAPITVAGINGPAPMTITGGTYSINGGAFTDTAGTVTSGQTVTVRHTSSATNSTVTTTTLTIGGVSAPFTSTTVAAAGVDTTPDAFTFTAQTGVPLSTVTSSNAITVGGINGPAPISITGGTYSIDGGTFVSTAGTVATGQAVTVRHTSSATNNIATTTTLTIGGVSADFTSTTLAGTAVDAAALYQSQCAGCHSLGTVDTTGNPNLSGTSAASRFPTPGVSVHQGRTLSADQISALTAYFQAN